MSASPVLSVPSILSFVSLHLSPFMCLLSGGVRLSGLVCALSPCICLPSCVSLHLSPVMWVGVVVVVVALAMVVLLVVVVVLVLVFLIVLVV